MAFSRDFGQRLDELRAAGHVRPREAVSTLPKDSFVVWDYTKAAAGEEPSPEVVFVPYEQVASEKHR